MKKPVERAAEFVARTKKARLDGAKQMYEKMIFIAVLNLLDRQDTITRDELVAELEAIAKEDETLSREFMTIACEAAVGVVRTIGKEAA